MSGPITIRGVAEFRNALGELESSLPKALDVALAGCADLVLTDARRRVPTRTGAARASLAVRMIDQRAEVVAGGSRAPYFGWLDFGGRVGRGLSVNRPYLANGRYVYFAHQGVQARYLELLSKALADAVAGAGFEAT